MSESNENNKLIDQVQEAALKEVPAEDIDLAADIPEVPVKAAKKSKKSKSYPVATKKTTIGGQALIEGVMMVGPSRTAKNEAEPYKTTYKNPNLLQK